MRNCLSMTNIYFWAALIVSVLYVLMLVIMYKRKVRKLWIPVIVIAALSSGMYGFIYYEMGVRSLLPWLTFSIMSAVKMFLGSVNSNCLFNVLTNPELVRHSQLILTIAATLFLCSVATTSYFVMYVLYRLSESRLWLWHNRKLAGKGASIIFGTDSRSIDLARDIASKGTETVILVDFPDKEDGGAPESFKYIFNLRSDERDCSSSVGQSANIHVLRAKRHLKYSSDANAFKYIGLERLEDWASAPGSRIFILSDDERENLVCLENLLRSDIGITVYCHARRGGLNSRFSMAVESDVHFIDSAFLIGQSLKSMPEFAPVNYVDVAVDKDNNKLGYVTSAFNSMIIGFGNAGQGALRFLYEFGAFPDKEGNKSGFHCGVIDRNMNDYLGDFFYRVPGLKGCDEVSFFNMTTGADSFRDMFLERLDALNYVVVALDDDNESLRVGLDLLETAFRYRKDGVRNLIIAVHVESATEHDRKIVRFYSDAYGDVLRLFGDGQSIWTSDNIFGLSFRDEAIMFYDNYQKATEGKETWEERRAGLKKRRRKEGKPELYAILELQRKEFQDMSNAWHRYTKMSLCSPAVWEDPKVAEGIPYSYSASHSDSGEPTYSCLEKLAVCEHLRYEASHIINGYILAPERNELKKQLENLVPYNDLSEFIKHYDWLVVKTSLMLQRKG